MQPITQSFCLEIIQKMTGLCKKELCQRAKDLAGHIAASHATQGSFCPHDGLGDSCAEGSGFMLCSHGLVDWYPYWIIPKNWIHSYNESEAVRMLLEICIFHKLPDNSFLVFIYFVFVCGNHLL